jgi:hypothetical protein
MPTKEIPIQLDDTGLEWLRMRFTAENGIVTSFFVQYEAVIDGKRTPVVRYDGVHGAAHRDLLDRKGRIVEKIWLNENMSFADALTFGQKDLTANWHRYRDLFLWSGE